MGSEFRLTAPHHSLTPRLGVNRMKDIYCVKEARQAQEKAATTEVGKSLERVHQAVKDANLSPHVVDEAVDEVRAVTKEGEPPQQAVGAIGL